MGARHSCRIEVSIYLDDDPSTAKLTFMDPHRVSPAAPARSQLPPREARALFRAGRMSGPTAGFSAGYAQANVVILPAAAADWFEAFCRANPRPCPLLERTPVGDPEPKRSAPGADLRTDLPRYRIYAKGRPPAESTDVLGAWRDDAVGFLLGCSFSFEAALTDAGLRPRYVEEGRNVPMYRTDRATVPAGPFGGPLVVSMRPVLESRIDEAIRITAAFPDSHGAPVHVGDPAALGIADLARPDYGDASTVRPGEVPLFWACGVTSQIAVLAALESGAIDWAMSHAPGHMLITDRPAGGSR
jgi:uncharacterized protein YcsI (UPF0317 family)